ncbi:MAG: L-rhamnose isomerase [Candidatus Moduliflexus flocculans]|nr:L-rhamnose isomerase [Candidatus Moduliflexus flocculans]
MRWDSDHVVLLNDEIAEVCGELVRAGAWDRVHLALDYFDGSLNRIGAWVIGARAVLKGLLQAFLMPWDRLAEADDRGDGLARLAVRENARTLPLGAVWDEYCRPLRRPLRERPSKRRSAGTKPTFSAVGYDRNRLIFPKKMNILYLAAVGGY